ncbi:Mu transposase domain-containing protein, partial [Escherichia coli]|uniref:Mu transposase domain-containing protein n=1 Tax=Escherichia coli TaxID=562 RepID=UPI0027E1FE8E
IDKHYYSVPCSLLGQQLEAWISGELVRLFNQGQEVAAHGHCVYQDDVAVADSGNTLTGQYAVHCIPVRPRTA